MSDLLKYKQVNWVDGMKINKDHFIALENHFTALINDLSVQMLNNNIYGLLPHRGDRDKFISIKTIIDNQNYLKVNVESCHAITPGGYRIEISKEEKGKGNFTIKNVEAEYDLGTAKEGEMYIILSVDPFSRVPVGKPEPKELPLRFPYINSEYKLHLISVDQFVRDEINLNMLPIGKLKVVDGTIETDQEYIPPCISIGSHSRLIEFSDYFDINISSLEKSTVKIIYDINEKHASNILTQIVTHISENLLSFISNNITRLRWSANSQTPISIFEFVVTLARVLKNSFDTKTAEEKEILLNYFSEHFGILPKLFKQLMDNTISINYNHIEIYESIIKVENFLKAIRPLFSELSKMELIEGKKKKESKKIDIVI